MWFNKQTCIQKNILLLLVLNLRTKTLPVVQAATALNSTSSGKMIRSSYEWHLILQKSHPRFLIKSSSDLHKHTNWPQQCQCHDPSTGGASAGHPPAAPTTSPSWSQHLKNFSFLKSILHSWINIFPSYPPLLKSSSQNFPLPEVIKFYLLSGLTILEVVLKVIFPARNSTKA